MFGLVINCQLQPQSLEKPVSSWQMALVLANQG
jgi:hypothetical protein